MKLARNLFFLFTVTVFALASVVLDTFNYDPYNSGNNIFINLFISLFIAIAGISAFIIYFLKIRIKKDNNVNTSFLPSVRQGLLIATGLIILIILRTLQILDWWVAGPMIIAVILLELFFQTNTTAKKQKLVKQN